ncbi:hypothetical protein B0H14DRAFT_3448793 [Mycena olivaceomarginata]|nr:hypothetical protein B0H14DRAFT_3448793 [Mycena olivaceomarginata]
MKKSNRDPFVVADLPGKGKGLVATRDIKQGELVIQESPLFTPRRFLKLSYVHFPEGLDPEQPRGGRAGDIPDERGRGGGPGGVFPRMARLNHGCSRAFNVVYTWRAREQQLFVHALRNISRGQVELLTTYTDTKRTRRERREFLSQQYGFKCTCAVSLRALVFVGNGAIGGVEAIRTINEIWKLEDEEGYWSERGRLAEDGAWIAASHSDCPAVGAAGY